MTMILMTNLQHNSEPSYQNLNKFICSIVKWMANMCEDYKVPMFEREQIDIIGLL